MILGKIPQTCSQLTSSEVNGSPAEPLDGPGVVVDDILLALGVTPPITRYGRQFAAPSTAGNIHCANHEQSLAGEEWQHKGLSKLFSLEKKICKLIEKSRLFRACFQGLKMKGSI